MLNTVWAVPHKLYHLILYRVFPGGSAIKNLPAMQETQVQSLGQEDPLEEGMASYSSILARRIPWTEEPGGLQFLGLQRVRLNLASMHGHTSYFLFVFCFFCFE